MGLAEILQSLFTKYTPTEIFIGYTLIVFGAGVLITLFLIWVYNKILKKDKKEPEEPKIEIKDLEDYKETPEEIERTEVAPKLLAEVNEKVETELVKDVAEQLNKIPVETQQVK